MQMEFPGQNACVEDIYHDLGHQHHKYLALQRKFLMLLFWVKGRAHLPQ